MGIEGVTKHRLWLVALTVLVVFQLQHAEAQDFKQLQQAAEQGFATAQFVLVSLYEIGEGLEEDAEEKAKEAVKRYERAAEQGDAAAQFTMGLLYLEGVVVEDDAEEGMKWLRKAAEQAHNFAQATLALAYAVEKDYVKAYAWFSLAAAHGHKFAGLPRDFLGIRMTTVQIAEAQELSVEMISRIESSKSQ